MSDQGERGVSPWSDHHQPIRQQGSDLLVGRRTRRGRRSDLPPALVGPFAARSDQAGVQAGRREVGPALMSDQRSQYVQYSTGEQRSDDQEGV